MLLGGYMISGCAAFGTSPSKDRIESFIKSKNFNLEKRIFQNRQPQLIEEMKKNTKSWGMIKDWFKGGPNRTPEFKLPEEKPDFTKFMEGDNQLKIIWFGHSSFLVNMEGTSILVDPVFSGSVAPVSFMVKRFQKPVVELSELPEIDYILISHDHYDHLDMHTIKFFVDKKTKFIAPLGVGSHLEGWGIEKSRITEKDWWENHTVDNIEFISTPAQHFSGRDGIHNDITLWCSWVVRTKNHNIYFSGDSGYDIHFKDIGNKYGPFDLAFIESGQYNSRWEAVHLMPKNFISAYQDLKAKKYFPVHWGMFELALHEWDEPIKFLFDRHLNGDVNLIAPKIGEIINPLDSVNISTWWEQNKLASQK